MRILLTGANGYIGRRLLPVLLQQGHEVVACVRNKNTIRLSTPESQAVRVVEVDFLNKSGIEILPQNIDVAYFLMHSLSSGGKGFSEKEEKLAENFVQYINQTTTRQIIYLSGISNDDELSDHLKSRQKTGVILQQSKISLTTLRAAIIIGSGSASFEIIRDLVEKLPVMIAPKWLTTKCQPIGIRNVIEYLIQCCDNQKVLDQTFDIGGPEVLTYKQMLLQFAEVREIKRWIGTVPIMTPKLSSYWLYFVTSTSYHLAVNLVDSMKNEVVVKIGNIQEVIPIELLLYKKNVSLAFKRIEQNTVISSWTDAELLGKDFGFNYYVQVPENGTFTDRKTVVINSEEREKVLANIWAIGGHRGWYYGNWMWKLRGYLDKLFGGVGLRRGRRSSTEIFTGDSLDFWRVILADKKEGRLLLFAEMKLPGEAWLELKTESIGGKLQMVQTATFRPRGVFGRMYWLSMLPFHHFIFGNMANNIVKFRPS